MEEKIVFPVGDETAQELKDKALSDEELSQVSGGKPGPLPLWECCGEVWKKFEPCGICGRRRG